MWTWDSQNKYNLILSSVSILFLYIFSHPVLAGSILNVGHLAVYIVTICLYTYMVVYITVQPCG